MSMKPNWRSAALVAMALSLNGLAVSEAMAQRVKLATTMGDIVLELDPAKAPKTVDNFVGYVNAGHYNGTVFHRVIDNFMIQGGGMTADLKEKPTRAPIPLESGSGLAHQRGTVAMARTNVPASATSQFFINVQNNDRLNGTTPGANGYAVFGKVVEGMDVVDRIRAVPVADSGPHQNVPVKPVLINKASVLP